MLHRPVSLALLLLALAACNPESEQAGAVPAFDGLPTEQVIYFTGTEPFWNGQIAGQTLKYSTPESPDGVSIPVTRFSGNHGIGLSGQLDGQNFDMTVTPGTCQDGMSDRRYPFTVTLRLDDELREGCGWTDVQKFTGPQNP